MSMSDYLTSFGRSGQTAIAPRSSDHERRSNASLFASIQGTVLFGKDGSPAKRQRRIKLLELQ